MSITIDDSDAIRNVLYRYCRGLDRMDLGIARSVFSDDCRANYHGMYQGSGRGFIEWVWQAHATMSRHSHQVNNVLIEFDGAERACSEAYVTVTLWQSREEGTDEIVCRGRYLDRWEKRHGNWLIVEREHVLDTQAVNGTPVPEGPGEFSRRDRDDPSYRFLRS